MGYTPNTTSLVLQIRPMKGPCKQHTSWGRPNTDTGGEFTLSGTAACDRGHDCRRHRPQRCTDRFDRCPPKHVSSVLADGDHSGKPFSEGVKQKLGVVLAGDQQGSVTLEAGEDVGGAILILRIPTLQKLILRARRIVHLHANLLYSIWRPGRKAEDPDKHSLAARKSDAFIFAGFGRVRTRPSGMNCG